jgi:hypothetical protein
MVNVRLVGDGPPPGAAPLELVGAGAPLDSGSASGRVGGDPRTPVRPSFDESLSSTQGAGAAETPPPAGSRDTTPVDVQNKNKNKQETPSNTSGTDESTVVANGDKSGKIPTKEETVKLTDKQKADANENIAFLTDDLKNTKNLTDIEELPEEIKDTVRRAYTDSVNKKMDELTTQLGQNPENGKVYTELYSILQGNNRLGELDSLLDSVGLAQNRGQIMRKTSNEGLPQEILNKQSARKSLDDLREEQEKLINLPAKQRDSTYRSKLKELGTKIGNLQKEVVFSTVESEIVIKHLHNRTPQKKELPSGIQMANDSASQSHRPKSDLVEFVEEGQKPGSSKYYYSADLGNGDGSGAHRGTPWKVFTISDSKLVYAGMADERGWLVFDPNNNRIPTPINLFN